MANLKFISPTHQPCDLGGRCSLTELPLPFSPVGHEAFLGVGGMRISTVHWMSQGA